MHPLDRWEPDHGLEGPVMNRMPKSAETRAWIRTFVGILGLCLFACLLFGLIMTGVARHRLHADQNGLKQLADLVRTDPGLHTRKMVRSVFPGSTLNSGGRVMVVRVEGGRALIVEGASPSLCKAFVRAGFSPVAGHEILIDNVAHPIPGAARALCGQGSDLVLGWKLPA